VQYTSSRIVYINSRNVQTSLSLVHGICCEAGAGNDYWIVFCKKLCLHFFPKTSDCNLLGCRCFWRRPRTALPVLWSFHLETFLDVLRKAMIITHMVHGQTEHYIFGWFHPASSTCDGQSYFLAALALADLRKFWRACSLRSMSVTSFSASMLCTAWETTLYCPAEPMFSVLEYNVVSNKAEVLKLVHQENATQGPGKCSNCVQDTFWTSKVWMLKNLSMGCSAFVDSNSNYWTVKESWHGLWSSK